MTNSTNIQGNNNIVVQGTEGPVQLSINQDDIKSMFAELKTLLQQAKVQEFQIADKIYNIENINEATFGFLTGNTKFNETLTKRLIDALKPHDKRAKSIAKKIDTMGASMISKVQDFLTGVFVGVIGGQLFTLFGIGKQTSTETSQRDYVEKCIFITNRSFDLINFALLSELWEFMKRKGLKLDDEQKEVLRDRFESSLECTLPEQFELLKVLYEIYSKNDLVFPIPEIGSDKKYKGIFQQQMEDKSDLHEVCLRFQKLVEKRKLAGYDILDCYEAETQLASLLGHFYFLINYNMISIKRIDYRQIRNLEPYYLHNYAYLGLKENSEKVNYTPDTAHTHTVLLYRGDNYKVSINLFPFVIDYNTLAVEDGTNICFFNSMELVGNGLSFICLEDESLTTIVKKGAGQHSENMSDFLNDPENRKSFNLDCVAEQFKAAQDCILGAE